MDEEYCCWCGQHIYEGEERLIIFTYDENDEPFWLDCICYDCWNDCYW